MPSHHTLDPEYFHKILVIDIETVPVVSDYSQMNESYQKHWLKKHHQISKYMEDIPDCEESFFQKAGIYAEFGKNHLHFNR